MDSEELENIAKLAGKGALEVRKQPIERILPEFGDLVPWIENSIVLIGAWERQLYAYAAVDWTTFRRAARRLDRAVLAAEANEGLLPGTLAAPIFLPVQIHHRALLELEDLS